MSYEDLKPDTFFIIQDNWDYSSDIIEVQSDGWILTKDGTFFAYDETREIIRFDISQWFYSRESAETARKTAPVDIYDFPISEYRPKLREHIEFHIMNADPEDVVRLIMTSIRREFKPRRYK